MSGVVTRESRYAGRHCRAAVGSALGLGCGCLWAVDCCLLLLLVSVSDGKKRRRWIEASGPKRVQSSKRN